jgi:parallel beta-helix repeat protein
MKKLLLILALFTGSGTYATNYFFSENGTDKGNGKSKSSPLKSIKQISALRLQPGDTIFFERGSIFRGSFLISRSGTKEKPIVFAAYGQGADPVLAGSILISNWKTTEGGTYSAPVKAPVMDVFVNGTRQTSARFPNTGFLNIDSGADKNAVYSRTFINEKNDFSGATLRLRTIDWAYEMRRVKNLQSGWFKLEPHPMYKDDRGMMVRSDNSTKTIYDLKQGYGFYLDGLPRFIDTATEWANSDKNVLLKPVGGINLEEATVEGTVEAKGIAIAANVSYISIKGIIFRQFYEAGIAAATNVKNIIIDRCGFSNIHVFGISIDSSSSNCVVTNCYVKDVLGKGIAVLEPENMLIENNEVRRIGLLPAQGFTGVNGATGISISNIESKFYLKPKYSHHNIVRYNTVDSCGYNGIRVDGSYNLVEKNSISYSGLTLNDGSALYCFATMPGITHHSIFRNNVVANSVGNNTATPANGIHFNGIYIDNNSHDMLVEGNTSTGHSSAGIVNNDGSYKNIYRDNVIFNCKSGIVFPEWARLGGMYENVVEGNTIVGLAQDQSLMEWINWLGDKTNFATLRNNRYIHTTKSNPFTKTTKQSPENSALRLSFYDWQRITGDSSEFAVTVRDSILKDYEPLLLVNKEKAEKKMDVSGEKYLDLKGTPLPSVQLPPLTSTVVLRKKRGF